METSQDTQATPSMTTYTGSCHCGRVRFEATFDIRAGLGKCNCTICARTNKLGARVLPKDFRLRSGEDALVDYQFNSQACHHLFCKHCGIHTHGHADIPQAGGEYYTVNVHCLDGADITDVPVRYFDGLHNNWWNNAPAFP